MKTRFAVGGGLAFFALGSFCAWFLACATPLTTDLPTSSDRVSDQSLLDGVTANHSRIFAFGVAPVIHPTWLITQINWDPANSSGTATDNANDCSSVSTPCLTWGHFMVQVWGCDAYGFGCPTLPQTVTLNIMSSQSALQRMTDPLIVDLWLTSNAAGAGAQGAQFIIDGASGVTTSTTTITALVAKQRTATATPLRVTVGAGGALQTLYVNTSRANSTAWPTTAQGGAFRMSQPLSFTGSTIAIPFSTENNAWTNGDNITLKTLPTIQIKYVKAHVGFAGTGEQALVIIRNVHGSYNTVAENAGDEPTYFSQGVFRQDSYFDNHVIVEGTISPSQTTTGSSNVFYGSGYFGGLRANAGNAVNTATFGGSDTLLGGAVFGGTTVATQSVFDGVYLDCDGVIGVPTEWKGYNFVGSYENDSVATVYEGAIDLQSLSTCGQGNAMWTRATAGTIDSGHGMVHFPKAAAGGANTFFTSNLQCSGGTTCSAWFQLFPDVKNLALTNGASVDGFLNGDAGCLLGAPTSGFCNPPL